MTTNELIAQGYAPRVYNINNDIRSWRVADERVIDLPVGAVKTYGEGREIAKCSEVMEALKRSRHATQKISQ